MSEISQIRALYGTEISSEMISDYYHQKIDEYVNGAEILPLVYKPALAELYTEYADELIKQKNFDKAVSMLTKAFLIYQSLWEKEHSKYDGCLQRTLNTLKSINDEQKETSLRESIRARRIKVVSTHEKTGEDVFSIRRPIFVGHVLGRKLPVHARRATSYKVYSLKRKKRRLLKLKKTGEG